MSDAEAQGMPWFIDEDDFDFDFGEDVESSMAQAEDYEVEQSVEDMELESEFQELMGPDSIGDEVDDMFVDLETQTHALGGGP